MGAIHSNKADISEFGSIVDTCKSILHNQQIFQVCFTKRQANKTTNTLAKVTCFYANPSIWYFGPSFIHVLLAEDLSTSFINNS